MAGYAHIIKLGEVVDSAGIRVPEYQFTYNDGSNSYARTFDEVGLVEFLKEDIALTPESLNALLTDLRDRGNTNVANLDIREQDASVMGLKEVPSDV
jgi:hypothetical protein